MSDSSQARVFRLIFDDTSIHAAELTRVRTRTWWDGEVTLLFESAVRQRVATQSSWSEDKVSTTVVTTLDGVAALATRAAVKLHDDFAAEAFKADDRACADMRPQVAGG